MSCPLIIGGTDLDILERGAVQASSTGSITVIAVDDDDRAIVLPSSVQGAPIVQVSAEVADTSTQAGLVEELVDGADVNTDTLSSEIVHPDLAINEAVHVGTGAGSTIANTERDVVMVARSEEVQRIHAITGTTSKTNDGTRLPSMTIEVVSNEGGSTNVPSQHLNKDGIVGDGSAGTSARKVSVETVKIAGPLVEISVAEDVPTGKTLPLVKFPF